MALAVAQAVGDRAALVVEAGTGVGKTFAYLVPALLSGERLLLSTATKALQDQLFGRDLPHVLKALGLPMRTALLKGRASYLCLHRLEAARQMDDHLTTQQELADIERWSKHTRTGDLAELPQLAERSGLALLVTSTRENCLGSTCSHWQACYVNHARRSAMVADVVVVNHHLLFADMAVRESGVAELLPTVGVVVVDEAHQLNDIGLQFLGEQWGSAQLRDLARDLLATAHPAALGVADWHALAVELERCTDVLQSVGRSAGLPGRYAWNPGVGRSEDEGTLRSAAPPEGVDAAPWAQALSELATVLQQTASALAMACEASPILERMHERCTGLWDSVCRAASVGDEQHVRWLELTAKDVRLVESPLDVGGDIAGRLMHVPLCIESASGPGADDKVPLAHRPRNVSPAACSWIFTSATLGDDKELSWFTEPCGLQGARTLRVSSPFDYATQAALYVPAEAPSPSDLAHSAWVASFAANAALQLGGRTLVLTTTLRALRAIGEDLRVRAAAGLGLDILVQGDRPKRWLMERFREGAGQGNPGCVLVASASFWEGFDVPGHSLQLVVIDKLPFPPPGDPLVLARVQRLVSKGRSAFAHHAVPEAAIALRQGAGRLIRSETDRGILVVCDPRLATQGYGKRLLRALPPMRRLEDAQAFDGAVAELARLTTSSTKACPQA